MSNHKNNESKTNSKETKISEKFGKVDLKEKEGEYFTKGYIATTHIDGVGDKCMKETLDTWAEQINSENNTSADNTSLHHEREDSTMIGRGTKGTATVEQLEDGEHGLFVETHHNKTHPKFADTVYELNNDFLSHYSIEYNTFDDSTTHRAQEDGDWVRYIEPETELVGYGLAAPRTVVNEKAKITNKGYKELVHLKESDNNKKPKVKEDKMEKKEEEKKPVDAPTEEKKEEQKKKEPEEKKEEEKPEEKKELKEYKDFVKFKEANEKIKNELKEVKPEGAPLIEDKEKIETIEKKEVEFKEYKDTFARKIPIDLSFKEREYLRNQKTNDLWTQSGKLHTQLKEKGAKFYLGDVDQDGTPFEIKENLIQYKGLDVETNYVGAQTTFPAILNNYEQTPAELNDIYGPAIVNQMNDETATWNKLAKVDGSGMSAIRIRARTNVVTGDEDVNQNFGSTPNFDGNVTRRKYNAWFVTRYADVQIEDEEIQLAKSTGGIGDIYAIEVRDRTKDLLTQVNSDLLTGDNTHPNAENIGYRFQNLIRTSGDLYGKTVTDTKDNKLAAAGVDNMSSAPITLKKLREMIDACLDNGAMATDLAFFGSRTQRTKIVTLLQALQRIAPTSGRVGFEEQIVIDQGIPYFPDKDADTDDIFLIDTAKTKVTIKVAPTYVEFAKVSLHRKGIVWMMYNITSDNPNHNYWIYGLQTT